ncbi:MAG: fibronectin-binding autotransporter adhesin [Verrucomicrobiota bacterium]|jgi:autotransporter-associated beta strand protein
MLSGKPSGTGFAFVPTGAALLLCALICFATGSTARAGSFTWTGNGGNANWSTATNWSLAIAPPSANTTDLHFAGSNNTGTLLVALNQNIATPFQLNNLFFDNAAGSFFLGGGDLAFTGAANTITQNSSSAQNIANNIAANTNSTVTLSLTGGGSGVVTLSGSINAGTGNRDYAITKTGTSTFSLTGASNYGGATTVSGGVLNIRSATALGSTASGTTVANGAALQIQGGIVVGTEALALNGSGIASDGAFRNISGNNSFAGAITLGSASTISSDSGTLTLSGAINNGGFLLTEMGAGNGTVTSVISGTGGLTKSGAGTLTLSGAASNTYTGATTVSQGTLILAKPGLVLAPAITIGGGGSSATVQLNAAYQLYGAAATINSLGQLNLNNFNEYVGTLTLSGASLTTGTGLLYLGGTITSNANAVSSTMAGNYVLYGNQTFNIASGTTPSGIDLIISGPISEFAAGTTVTKTGAGEFVFSGANTYSGVTTISAGVLNIQHASALGTTGAGTTVASGAALQIQGGINVGNEPLALSGSGISNTGAFRNISGTNSFGGTITLASASTIYSDAGTLTLTGGTVNGGFTATFGGPSNISASGVTSGTGALQKTGAGTLTLTGANTFSGGTTIDGGTLTAGSASGNALGSTSSITVNAGGTLLLSTANNQINDAATIMLHGGTFNRGTVSEGGTNAVGMGALTLSATNSHIDFGTGAVGVLTFASFIPSGFVVTIDNWTGTAGVSSGNLGDQLIFDANQSGNLNSFWFTGYVGAVEINLGGGFYEVVPAAVPEPATYVSGFLAFAAVLFHHRKQVRALFRRRIAAK